MTVYDTHFNANEWFIIIGLCTGYLLLFLLPKRFPKKVTFVFVICGIYSGFFYDHSLSVEPVNFYDVNDTSNYQVFDFLSYLMFGPWSYLFFYIWDRFKYPFRYAPIYIVVWVLLSLGFERASVWCHVYHYKNGYSIRYSLPIYFFTLSIWSVLFHTYQAKNKERYRF